MKRLIIAPLLLAGCVQTTPLLNPSGNTISHAPPVLSNKDQDGAYYAIIEKSIADGKYRLHSLSKEKTPLQNERQERIAFNKSLTKFATDFNKYEFKTYSDVGNYGEETQFMLCRSKPDKLIEYSPCSSAFGSIFIPTGITKQYAAGRLPYDIWKQWNNPRENLMREALSPENGLVEAGVFEKLREISSAALVTEAPPAHGARAQPQHRPPLRTSNNWNVSINNEPISDNYIYASIQFKNDGWEILKFYRQRPQIPKDSAVELFAVSRDLQQWRNAVPDLMTGCEESESDSYSVCSSEFATSKVGILALRVLFSKGSKFDGRTPYGYSDSAVKEAINSINPEQAEQALISFEKGS